MDTTIDGRATLWAQWQAKVGRQCPAPLARTAAPQLWLSIFDDDPEQSWPRYALFDSVEAAEQGLIELIRDHYTTGEAPPQDFADALERFHIGYSGNLSFQIIGAPLGHWTD